MTFPTITQAELEAVGVVGLADTPGLDARAMQEKFEETSRALLAPKYNELTSLLESAQGAQAGCAVPAGLPADTPATVQGVVNALDAAIDRKVLALGAGDMAQAVYDPAHLGADVTVQPYAHTKTGTVHALTGAGANGRVRMTADVAEGDTVTVNGKAVPAWAGAEDFAAALAGQPLTGRWLSFVFDGAQVNFKGGGGAVTVEGLAAENIVAGQTVTVRQGTKVVAQVEGGYSVTPWYYQGGISTYGSIQLSGSMPFTGTVAVEISSTSNGNTNGQPEYGNWFGVGTSQDEAVSNAASGFKYRYDTSVNVTKGGELWARVLNSSSGHTGEFWRVVAFYTSITAGADGV